MSKELVPMLDYEDKKLLATIQQTVAKDASPAEFRMFIETCKSSGLNPFQKDIWFIKTNGRVQMMTGINGYLKIANRHPEYDGMEIDYKEDDKGKLVSYTAKVYRKDRKYPSIGMARLDEYAQSTPIWKSKPHVMLAKVAKSIALREAFSQETAGLYTQEEMPPEYSSCNVPDIEEPINVTPSKEVEAATKEQTIAEKGGTWSMDEIEKGAKDGSLKKGDVIAECDEGEAVVDKVTVDGALKPVQSYTYYYKVPTKIEGANKSQMNKLWAFLQSKDAYYSEDHSAEEYKTWFCDEKLEKLKKFMGKCSEIEQDIDFDEVPF